MVVAAGQIHVAQRFAGCFLIHVQMLHAVADPGLVGGVEVDAEQVGKIPQGGVPAAAHDDAGALESRVPDDAALHVEDLVGDAVAGQADALRPVGEERIPGDLLRVADHGQALAHAPGGLLHNVPIPEFHLQHGGEPLDNGAPQRAELPGNGDHIMLHDHPPQETGRAGVRFMRFCMARTTQDRV